MMSTILTLIVLGMVFQGVLAVLNSILDTVGVGSMLGSIPVVGSSLHLDAIGEFIVGGVTVVCEATVLDKKLPGDR